MNKTIENLLQPLSAEHPCGPDLSNDGAFEGVETLLKGKPEVEMGSVQKPAEPPDWRELRASCATYLAKSKQLRVAVIFCGSLLKTEGLPGFRDGLELIAGYLEQFWAAVHPLLDPEDNNDPAMRLNILRSLTLERGASAAGWLTIVDYLYGAEVCRPKGLPPIIFEQVISSNQTGDNSKLSAAIRSVGAESLTERQQAIKESLEAVHRIDQFLTTTVGSTETISFEVLQNALKELLGVIEAYIPDGASESGALSADGAEGSGGESAGGISVRGPIRSRDDVVRTIDGICAYYEQVEPGSPVPYLLRRVQKVVKMNFIEAIQELNIATVDALRPTLGSAVDGDTSSSGAPVAQEAAAEGYGAQS
jgi:type VI secretion system protein ImpA